MRVATGNGNLHANKGQQRLFLTGICKAIGPGWFPQRGEFEQILKA